MKRKTEDANALIPIHQWTNSDGEVLIVRCISLDGKSYKGFQNPLTVGDVLTAPEAWDEAWGPKPDNWKGGWIPDQECGGGIHGWPWGMGLGDGKEPDWRGLWQVYGAKPEDVIGYVGDSPKCKCKFREGVLRYSGDWHGAAMFVLNGQMEWTFHNSRGSASNSGDRGSASNSGYSGSASNSGYSGSASNSGDSGSASNSGYSGSASNSGDRGSASNSGYRGSASNSGDRGSASTTATGTAAMCTGLNSRVRAGEFGCIALAWWNQKEQRVEMRCALTGSGEGALKPDVWYRLNEAGEFVERD